MSYVFYVRARFFRRHKTKHQKNNHIFQFFSIATNFSFNSFSSTIMYPFALRFTFLLILSLISVSGQRFSTIADNVDDDTQNLRLMTTLFTDKCVGSNYTIYETPIATCYNRYSWKTSEIMNESYINHDHLNLFGSDDNLIMNPYGKYDITDELIKINDKIIGISRSFYKSDNGTCTGGITDMFPNIPLDNCVGPFGEPFPWGYLQLISSSKKDVMTSS